MNLPAEEAELQHAPAAAEVGEPLCPTCDYWRLGEPGWCKRNGHESWADENCRRHTEWPQSAP